MSEVPGEPAAKKRRVNDVPSPTPCLLLDMLDEDSLRSILLRTPAIDHHNLRQTCRRVNHILESIEFRRMRGVLGYAEVKVELLPPFQQYKIDHSSEEHTLSLEDDKFLHEYDDLSHVGKYGNHNLAPHVFQVCVDKVPLLEEDTQIRVHLLPRTREVPFHEMCDAADSAFKGLSVNLFTNNGNPRVKSLKCALTTSSLSSWKKPLLYISDFKLPEEHRSVASTIGPLILRSILTETLLKDRWDLAMYIPHYSAQILKEESTSHYIRNQCNCVDGLTEEEGKDEKQWQQRFDELTLQDMRQFFRAGFHQVNDKSVVGNGNSYYLYATPADIGNNSPILTESQALARYIATPDPAPPRKTDPEKELLNLIIGKCFLCTLSERLLKHHYKPTQEQALMEDLDEHLRVTRERIQQHEEERSAAEEAVAQAETCTASLESVQDKVRTIDFEQEEQEEDGVTKSEVESTSSRLGCTRLILKQLQVDMKSATSRSVKAINCEKENLETLEVLRAQLVSQVAESTMETLAKTEQILKNICAEIRSKVVRIIEESNYTDTIIRSDAIHACAANKNMPFAKMLLELIPDPKKKIEALNHFDGNGMTPLMVAARYAGGSNLEKEDFRGFCVQLLNLGADVNLLQAKSGLSSLGCFRQGQQDSSAFDPMMRLHHFPELSERYFLRDLEAAKLEMLLKPANGETPTDRAILDEEMDEEEGEVESLDEEDEEENDEVDDEEFESESESEDEFGEGN